jgi:hypothetical protein
MAAASTARPRPLPGNLGSKGCSRYGEDVLQLVIASGYLSMLTRNAGIKRYLSQHHPEILSEFNAIISATSLDQASTMAMMRVGALMNRRTRW